MSIKIELTSAPFFKALFLFLLPIHLFSQTIILEGRVKSDNHFVFISYLTKNGTFTDSITIRGNKFCGNVKISENKKYRIKLNRTASEYFEFYYSSPITHLRINKDIEKSKVRNPSNLQIDFLKHNQYVDNFWKKNKNYTAKDLPPGAIGNIDLRNEEIQDSINNLRITHELQYYWNNPTSLSSLESLELLLKRKYGKARYLEFKSILEIIPSEMNTVPSVVSIRDFISIYDKYHALKKFPLIQAVDLNNENINSDSIAKGKFLLIDFWASWCMPCRSDHPQLIKFYQENKGKLEILSLSIDENTGLWRKAILDDGVGLWRHISMKENDLHRIRRDLMVFSIPVKILVGADGEIIKRWEGANDEFFTEMKGLLDN